MIIPMYVERVPNRNSPPAVLLRSSHWDHGKIRKVTHANISKLPQPLVDGIALLLRGGTVVGPGSPAVRILDSRPCGHVAALLGGARQLGLPGLLHVRPSRSRDLALALVLMRLLLPASRLATARKLAPDAEFAVLNEALGLGPVSEQQLYDTLDWLARRQPAIEAKLARRHLQDGCLALYDLTSVWYTGEHCELARRGYSRDGKRGSRQIVVGLLCDAAGRPVSAEVCAGNTADPATVPAQVDKLRRRFGLSRVVLVGDRGMLTAARIREDLAPHEDLGWISALRAPAIRQLLRAGRFDPEQVGDWQLVRIESPDYPGERLLVCRNPRLRRERGQRREALLQATEAALAEIGQATQRRASPLRGDALKLRVHAALGQYKMRKHFRRDRGRGPELATEQRQGGRRGRAGRPVRDPRAGASHAAGRRRGGARLQEPGRGRARLPASQDRGPGTAPVLRARSRPRAGAHAGVPAWPTTWNGTCGRSWRRCCTRSTTAPPLNGGGTRPWPRPGTRPPPKPSAGPGRPPRATLCGTSAACWGNWARCSATKYASSCRASPNTPKSGC